MLVKHQLSEKAHWFDGTLPEPEGGAANFAFLIFITQKEDFLIAEPSLAKRMHKPEEWFYLFSSCFPVKAFGSAIVEHKKLNKAMRRSHGVFILVPYFASQYQDPKYRNDILKKIEEATHLAKNMNAHIVGLGGPNSSILNNGKKLADKNILPVTSGSTMTAVGAVKGNLKACKMMRIKPANSTITIVGATGAVGRTVSLLIAKYFQEVNLVARNKDRLDNLYELISSTTEGNKKINLYTDVNEAIANNTKVLVTATNIADRKVLTIDPNVIAPGSIINVLSIPYDIDPEIKNKRNDIFIFDGAIFKFRGQLDCANIIRMGEPDEAYGCLKETMDLAIAGIKENYSIGPLVDYVQVKKVIELSKKYYSPLAGWRFNGEKITKKDIKEILKNTKKPSNQNLNLIPQTI